MDEIIKGWNVTKLTNAGANRWTKYGKDRMYLQNIDTNIIGLDVDRYNTGNICKATFNGEKISNSEAYRILGSFSKSYIDLEDGKIYGCSENEYGEGFIKNMNNNFKEI